MGRLYGTDETGAPLLLKLECDTCGKTRKPGPDSEGWTVHGTDNGPGTTKLYWYYCDDCGAYQ